jgi:hypothetical protein
MGIAIGYGGKLNDPAERQDAVLWLHSKCAEWKWQCEDVTEEISGVLLRRGKKTKPTLIEEDLSGVWIQPPACERLAFTFDSKGKLKRVLEIPHVMMSPIPPDPNEKYFLEFPFWCKTTGHPDCHLIICGILRGLKDRYMRNLRVSDDAGYWRTGSLNRLLQEHRLMSSFLGAMTEGSLRAIMEAAGHPLPPGATVTTETPTMSMSPQKRKPREGPLN